MPTDKIQIQIEAVDKASGGLEKVSKTMSGMDAAGHRVSLSFKGAAASTENMRKAAAAAGLQAATLTTRMRGMDAAGAMVSKTFGQQNRLAGALSKSFHNTAMSALKLVAAYAGFNALRNVTNNMLKVADVVGDTRVRFEALTGSMGRAVQMMKFARDAASELGVSTQDMRDAIGQLLAVDMAPEKWLKPIADFAAATGKEMSEATALISRAFVGGMNDETLAALRDPALRGALKDIVKDGDLGKLSMQGMRDAIFDVLSNPKLAGAAKRMNNDWAGMVQRMKNYWEDFLVAVAESGALKAAEKWLMNLLARVKEMARNGELQAWAERTGRAIKRFMESVVAVVGFIIQHRTLFVTAMFTAGAYSGILKIAAAVRGVANALYGLRAAGIAAASIPLIGKLISPVGIAAATGAGLAVLTGKMIADDPNMKNYVKKRKDIIDRWGKEQQRPMSTIDIKGGAPLWKETPLMAEARKAVLGKLPGFGGYETKAGGMGMGKGGGAKEAKEQPELHWLAESFRGLGAGFDRIMKDEKEKQKRRAEKLKELRRAEWENNMQGFGQFWQDMERKATKKTGDVEWRREEREKAAADLAANPVTFAGGWEKAIKDIKEGMNEMALLGINAAQRLRQGFSDTFFSFLTGEIRNIGDLWRNLMSDMKNMFLRTLADMMAKKLMTNLMGAITGTGTISGIGSGIKGILGLAAGGPAHAGRSYIVGERGPELFSPGASGRVTPIAAGGGGVTINVQAMDAASFEEYLAANGSGVIARLAAQVAPGAIDADIRRGGAMRNYYRG